VKKCISNRKNETKNFRKSSENGGTILEIILDNVGWSCKIIGNLRLSWKKASKLLILFAKNCSKIEKKLETWKMEIKR